MTDYNFAKNYENLKDWEFKNQSVSDTVAGNYVDQFLNLIKLYPNLFLLIKTKKILFVPTLFVLAGVVIVEMVALVPTINIKRLESIHYEYEDKVNALNIINLDRENKFKILKEHSSLLSNPSPAYLFGFHLQESFPKNVQLLDYLVDNSGFKLNANSSDLVSTNKFISLLLENKLIEKDSIKINRIINQSSNNQSSFSEQTFPVDSVSIDISGNILHLPLKERIQLAKLSNDLGKFKKLNTYFELLELLR
tara:strand:+ start:482 stop:1234 length:753 start_codon:yes stop_codon:yes gene_type:complete